MGDKNILNNIKASVTPIMASTEEILALNFAVPRGTLLFNTDTRELKIADGIKNPEAMLDHRHVAYANIAHSHLSSVNEPWLMANPRLFYRDELINHPELIALDGQDIDDATAEFISRVYPGTKNLIEPCTWSIPDAAYGNNVYTINATSNKEGFTINKVTGSSLDVENLLFTNDQWLIDGSDEVSITYSFKGDHQFVIDEYWLIPAAGDNTVAAVTRPTPKSWILSGTNDNVTWVELDKHENVESSEWNAFTIRTFKTTNKTLSNKVRLTITEWNIPSGSLTDAGLRRFWLFGKKENVFSVPLVESPSDAFAWVIPKHNLYVGMHHETVGDICYPAQLTEVTALNRILADGSDQDISRYDELFAVLGHKYDVTPTSMLVNVCGTDEETETMTFLLSQDIPDVACVSITVTDNSVEPNAIEMISTSNYPKHVVLETVADDGTISVIADYPDYSQLNNRVLFQIDDVKTYDMYRNIRVNIISWVNTDPVSLNIQVTSHVKGKFRLPQVPNTGDLQAYVVTNNSVVDVSPEIIQKLQKNHIELAATVSELVNRLDKLDPNLGG